MVKQEETIINIGSIKPFFASLQKQMISKLSANRAVIGHNVTKGDACELNWLEWLKTYLPKRYCADKAFIIDNNGAISEQIDIVIYDQQYTPFVFNQDGAIYIPAESVYAIFEVKQELSKEYIEYAGGKARSVRCLERTSAPIPHAGGEYSPKPHTKIIAGILTLSSTWTPPLGESFEKCMQNLRPIESLDIGCVIEAGSFITKYTEQGINIEKSTSEESLIFFFLKLVDELQRIGTIPAIDIQKYASALDSV